jgi:hypothetical protein
METVMTATEMTTMNDNRSAAVLDEDTGAVRDGPHVFTDRRANEGVDDVISYVDEHALFAT